MIGDKFLAAYNAPNKIFQRFTLLTGCFFGIEQLRKEFDFLLVWRSIQRHLVKLTDNFLRRFTLLAWFCYQMVIKNTLRASKLI